MHWFLPPLEVRVLLLYVNFRIELFARMSGIMFHGTNQSQDKKVQSKIQDGNLSNMVLGGEYS
jgi:hypothetical protein